MMKTTILAALTAAAFAASPALAVPVLDQSQTDLQPGAALNLSDGTVKYAQSFKSGYSAQLLEIAIYIASSAGGQVTLDLYSGVGDPAFPAAPLGVASAAVGAGNVATELAFDFSSLGIMLTDGANYTFRVAAAPSNTAGGYRENSAYADGDLYFTFGADGFYPDNAGWDMYFKTFVEGPAAAPAPGTLALLGLGIAGLGVARRRAG